MHTDMEHADHTLMTMECKRLGSKINKSMDLRVSRIIQEYINTGIQLSPRAKVKSINRASTLMSLLEENR